MPSCLACRDVLSHSVKTPEITRESRNESSHGLLQGMGPTAGGGGSERPSRAVRIGYFFRARGICNRRLGMPLSCSSQQSHGQVAKSLQLMMRNPFQGERAQSVLKGAGAARELGAHRLGPDTRLVSERG